MLTGLIPPTAGSASVYGRGLEDLPSLRRTMGFCPQHDVLFDELSVMEHLRLFSAIKGVPAGDVEAEAAKSLALVGLTEKAHARVGGLSGGQKRKLSVCLAFLGGSKVGGVGRWRRWVAARWVAARWVAARWLAAVCRLATPSSPTSR